MGSSEKDAEIIALLQTFNKYAHTLDILYLLTVAPETERVHQTYVREGIGVDNAQTVKNSLDILEELKLIETRMDMPRTLWIELTPKGKQMGRNIMEMGKLLTDP
jgi:DNA-binding MarR family transcriptional regulator